MKESLKRIMIQEKHALENMLVLLEEQHNAIAKDSLEEMNKYVSLIDESSKQVARAEVERRRITGEVEFKKLIYSFGERELEELYRDIRKTLEGLTTQKETNDLMLKQKLSFTNSMLLALKPKNTRRTGVYNSYGKVKR